MKTKYYGILTLIFTAIAFICLAWLGNEYISAFYIELGAFGAAVVSLLLFISSTIAGKRSSGKKINGMTAKYFTIAMTALTVLTAVYGVYDYLTDTGFMAGIAGFIILAFVVPPEAVITIIGFVVFLRQKKKCGKNKQ